MVVQDPMKVEVDSKGEMMGDAFILDILQKNLPECAFSVLAISIINM